MEIGRTTLRPNDRVKKVRREYRARRSGCYVLQDKYGVYLVVTQKLALLVNFVNSVVSDKASRVSLSGLYEMMDSSGKDRVGGYTKHRWKLSFASLDSVAALIEQERTRFEQVLILGPPECYQIDRRDG